MRNSFECNNMLRHKSLDKKYHSRIRISLNKIRRKSMMDPLKYINAKNESEEEAKNNYISSAKLNILNILNNCINEDLYDDLPFNKNQNNNLNDNNNNNNKNIEIKKGKKNRRNTIENKNRINLDSHRPNYNNIKKALSNKTFRKKEKLLNNIFSEKEIPENKANNNLNKLRYRSKGNRKSVNLPDKTILASIGKKFKNNNNNNEKHYNNRKKFGKTCIMNNGNNGTKDNILKDLSEIEKIKVNEHIFNDINSLQLKKRIVQFKKALKKRSSVDLGNNNNKGEINHHLTNNNSIDDVNNKSNYCTTNETYKSNLIKKVVRKNNLDNEINPINNKYRMIKRKVNLFDSLDDEEYLDEDLDYYISPNSLFIKIFDFLIIFSSLFYFIIIPFFLSQNDFILQDNNLFIIILIIIDVLYIIDVIINFFRAYKNYDEKIIKRTKKIISHYFKTLFLIDLIQAFPYFSLLHYMKEKYNFNYPRIYILLMIKAIKIYNSQNNNSFVSDLSKLFSKSEIIDDNKSNIMILFLLLSSLNITTCLFIFLGRNTYPSWIIKLNIQDENYINVYLTSLYFIIVTITTVGYGDITGNTVPEILFQIMLLILGTIAYSFIISYVSNYIVKINQKSINFENKLNILNEIKLHHPNMSNETYNEVLRNLHNEELYQKKDKHLLFENLPYSLKNELIIQMYKPIINNFVFFKDIDNSDFIVKVATSLKPLISIKGDILVQEADYIKEIFFVKKGVLGLYISIDLNDRENSIQKYYDLIEIGKLNGSHIKTTILSQKTTDTKLLSNTFLLTKDEEDSSYIEKDYNDNIEDINIIQLRAKEHFGDALMFLNERCPLNVRIRSKTAELLILRKMEAIEIYSIYPNIWKRINKKSLYNMEQIYIKIKKH